MRFGPSSRHTDAGRYGSCPAIERRHRPAVTSPRSALMQPWCESGRRSMLHHQAAHPLTRHRPTGHSRAMVGTTTDTQSKGAL